MEITREIVEETLQNLRKRGFDAHYCETAEEGRELALSLIPAGDTVAWGGSVTAVQIGLMDAVKARTDIELIDRDVVTDPAEKRQMMRKGLLADSFIAGVNGISRDGWLVNIDGTGNRVAAITFGPENVILVAGVNKIENTVTEAMDRARNVAAPLNVKRLNIPNPCLKSGKCMDCKGATTAWTAKAPPPSARTLWSTASASLRGASKSSSSANRSAIDQSHITPHFVA